MWPTRRTSPRSRSCAASTCSRQRWPRPTRSIPPPQARRGGPATRRRLAEARQLLAPSARTRSSGATPTGTSFLAYCRRSADPVGHFLLAARGAGRGAEPANALCTALQILNHLQDLGPDRAQLDRVYLPVPWMDRVGGEERLRRCQRHASAGARRGAGSSGPASGGRGSAPVTPGQHPSGASSRGDLDLRADAQPPLAPRGPVAAARVLAPRGCPPCRRPGALAPVATAAGTRRSPGARPPLELLFGSAWHPCRGTAARHPRGLRVLPAVDDTADGEAPPAERLRLIGRWRRSWTGSTSAPARRSVASWPGRRGARSPPMPSCTCCWTEWRATRRTAYSRTRRR